MNYNDYKNKTSSEKISLAILKASKRLLQFTEDGDKYRKDNFKFAVIAIKAEDVLLTEVDSSNDMDENTFFNDRENEVLYIRLQDDVDPNTVFMNMIQTFFYASAPLTLPWDLDEGYEVFFEPLVDSTSSFGVEIDTVNQQNEAIEGTGTLTLKNDQDFWPKNFDKLFFENQVCEIYSYSSELPASESKLIFRGKVESKTYSASKITFKLKDLMADLKDAVPLKRISETNYNYSKSLSQAYQRMIFGKVDGHKPVNIDFAEESILELTGSIAVTQASVNVTGTGTNFLKEVSPGDQLILNGEEYNIDEVTSDTALTLSEAYELGSTSFSDVTYKINRAKRWINRQWLIAGHKLRQPAPVIEEAGSNSMIFVSSTDEIFEGDDLLILGQVVTVSKVYNDKQILLATSLAVLPPPGTPVIRPPIQRVRMNDTLLKYGRDFTVDAETAILTLNDDAEVNASRLFEENYNITITAGSRNVTGATGADFSNTLKPGDIIRPKGTVEFFEILDVVDETHLILKTAPLLTVTNRLQYKNFIFEDGTDVLSCEVLGRTDNGETTGKLLQKGPEIIKTLLIEGGHANEIDYDSFDKGMDLSSENLAFVVPTKVDDKDSMTYRDLINKINKSIFGIIYQNQEFKYSFDLLRPTASVDMRQLDETDILAFKLTSTNKNMIKKAIVEYAYKEYDYTTLEESNETVNAESDIARYILGTSKERVFESCFREEKDALRLAKRWKFLLEFATNEIEIETKLQTIDLEINDIIDISHPKMYERFGGTTKRKIIAVQRIQKSAKGVVLAGVDLSNAFNRIGLISETESNYENTPDDTRLITGFYKDSDGMIDGDEETFYNSLIW